MMRVWEKPVTTYSVAVARIGAVTTTTVGRTLGAKAPPPARRSPSRWPTRCRCSADAAARTNCSKRPAYRVVPPPPSGEEPGMIAVADLPPVGRISTPWVGIEATGGRPNPSKTTCDRANFGVGGARSTRARTFVIPKAKLPARFGLSETYGRFRLPEAGAGSSWPACAPGWPAARTATWPRA